MKAFGTILFFLLTTFFVFEASAQDCKKLQALYKRGLQEKESWNYAKAFKIFTQVERQAKENQCYDLLSSIKFSIGSIYSNLSNYAQSLDYFQQALAMTEEYPDLRKEKVSLLHNIGYLYVMQNNREKGLEYLKKSYTSAKKYDSDFRVAISLADIYAEMGKLDRGMQILKDIEDKLDKQIAKQRWKATYAEILHLKGKTAQAKKIAEKLYLETQKDKKGVCNRCVLELLTQIYTSLNEYDRAIEFAKKGLKNTNVLGWKIKFYEKLAGFYLKKEDYRTAFQYKDSVIIAKDSLSGINNEQLFQISRIKFEVQEYQNQIKQNRERQKAERILFFVLIGSALLALFFVFKILRSRIQKQKQRRVLAENKQRITALQLENEKKEHRLLEEQSRAKQEKLKNKISQKNRMLSANALYHADRNELLEKIISSLTDISTASEKRHIKDYIKELKGYMNTDAGWKDFIHHFEKVNPGFLKTLTEKFPDLTKKDLRFLCYLYMNLGTKEICNILNISPEAVWKRKQRIAKKMGMTADKLYDFLLHMGEE